MIENFKNKLKTVEEISMPILGLKPARTYALIRKGVIPLGVVVRLGKRQIRINEQKLFEWVQLGGSATSEQTQISDFEDKGGNTR